MRVRREDMLERPRAVERLLEVMSSFWRESFRISRGEREELRLWWVRRIFLGCGGGGGVVGGGGC